MEGYPRGALPPVQRFAAELRRLRIAAGDPQLKTIAARAQCSQATVSETLNGHRLPSETVTRRLVTALGGDWARWKELWRDVRTELDELKHPTPRTPQTLQADMVCYPDPPALYRAAADPCPRGPTRDPPHLRTAPSSRPVGRPGGGRLLRDGVAVGQGGRRVRQRPAHHRRAGA
ncbi:helix-turn-helix domain-containing protein [Streptomyces sp. NPDC059994]|uniref:helix-turn-helix domain-containing protein n=1 Tax=Streptomyces sp. NPDC059994 TaxID=3347029 RepID=UPI003686D9EF